MIVDMRQLLNYLSPEIRSVLSRLPHTDTSGVEEIRMRVERPLMIQNDVGEFFVTEDGRLSKFPADGLRVSKANLEITLDLLCKNSVFAMAGELKSGFVTIVGGCRVGISGKAVLSEGKISYIKDVSGINIRIARGLCGVADSVIPRLIQNGQVRNTLIISPPQCGKTTMLRDIARQLSDGVRRLSFPGVKVGIVDERSEIAACHQGIPIHDVGVRTDVLDGCPKAEGMIVMIRSMSPDVIVTDELGLEEDISSLKQVMNAGVKIITSVHGYSREDILNRPNLRELLESNAFECVVELNNKKEVSKIYA